MLLGVITRKDLMTFNLSKKVKANKAAAELRGWVARRRNMKRLEKENSQKISGIQAQGSPSKKANNPRATSSRRQSTPFAFGYGSPRKMSANFEGEAGWGAEDPLAVVATAP